MTSRLEAALKRLPEDLQDQVADYVEFLTQRGGLGTHSESPPQQGKVTGNRLSMSWAGKLPPRLPGETGVDVSHEALQIRVQQVEDKLRSKP